MQQAIDEKQNSWLTFLIFIGGQLDAIKKRSFVFNQMKMNYFLKRQIIDHLRSSNVFKNYNILDESFLFLGPLQGKIRTVTNGQSLLHIAVTENYDQTKLLIENNANVNCTDFLLRTPLHMANLDLQCAQLLIDNKADVNARDKDGKTPLHFEQCSEVLELLITNNAVVNTKDRYLRTPLHYAVKNAHCKENAHWNGDSKVIKLLIEHKAEIDTVDVFGKTPFGLCLFFSFVTNHYIDLIKLLVEEGADVNKQHIRFVGPPLHYASREGNLEVCKIAHQKQCKHQFTGR